MPLPVIPDTYRIQLNWQNSGGARAVNVMHVRRASSSASAVATIIDANVVAGLWQSTTTATAVASLLVTPLDGSSASFLRVTSGAKWAGPGSGDIIPQMCALVKLQTLFRGPAHRGRLYLPFVTETGQASGTLLTTDVTAGQNAWNTFLAALITAGCPLVVASYHLGTQVDVVSVQYEPKAATQRMRMTRLR